MATETYKVSGMTCEHCVHAVHTEVSKISGVEKVDISLVPEGISSVTVTSSAPLAKDDIVAAIDEAGYALA